MNTFDLNIKNYKTRELESMLELSKPYTYSDVIANKNKLKEKVLGETSMNINKKNEIAIFLDNASTKLISSMNESQNDSSSAEATSFDSMQNTLIQHTGSNNIVIQSPSILAGLRAKGWEGRLSDNSDQPPGFLNPINIRTIKRTVNVDTRFRPNYYNTSSTNFSIQLPLNVNKVVSMRIASIEIPMTYHVVSKHNGNSFFKIDWDYDAISGLYNYSEVVMIPDGNYEPSWQDATKATDLASTVNAFMHALPDPSGKLKDLYFNVDRTSGRCGFAWDATGTTPPETFRVTFGISSDGTTDITTNLQFRLGWLFGFRVSSYEGEAIVSEGICYMKGPRYAFISINDFQNSSSNYFVSAFASSIMQQDIIARINLTSIQQNQGVYQSGQDDGFSTQINRQRNYFGPVEIQKLEIKLIDEYGRIIDLNNMDWSIALTMECLYDN
jgi:hypothetical protein